jgi:hypothetical protein
MRSKAAALFPIVGQSDDESPLTIVQEYHAQLQTIDTILSSMPEVLQLAHDDFTTLSQAPSGTSSVLALVY